MQVWCHLMPTQYWIFRKCSSSPRKRRRKNSVFSSFSTHGENTNGRVRSWLLRSMERLFWCLELRTKTAASLREGWWWHLLDKHWRLCRALRSTMCMQVQQKLHLDISSHILLKGWRQVLYISIQFLQGGFLEDHQSNRRLHFSHPIRSQKIY